MSIADATSLVATPLAFVVWGIVWARCCALRSSPSSRS